MQFYAPSPCPTFLFFKVIGSADAEKGEGWDEDSQRKKSSHKPLYLEKSMSFISSLLALILIWGVICPSNLLAQMKNMTELSAVISDQREMDVHSLPPLPKNLPTWFKDKKKNHIFYKRGVYNYDIYNIKRLAYDMNAVAVGHAMAYEDLVTGKATGLETDTFNRINWMDVQNQPSRTLECC